MIKVLIADDHEMFVDGLESLLQDTPDIEVVDRCYNGNDVIPLLESKEIDVVLLDINLPEKSGIEISKEIRENFDQVKVLALTMYNEESFIREILKHGAMGYILKNTGKNELTQAIRTVFMDGTYFSKDVTKTIIKSKAKKAKKHQRSKFGHIPKLSNRELQVLSLIVKEFTNPEIAEKLHISFKTVESHRANLLSKLNVRNTAGLVKVALQHKLVEHEK